MLFLLICLTSSFAFFSPNTLQQVGISIGPTLQYLIVIFLSGIITFFIKIKNKMNIKKTIYVFTVILLVLLTIFILINSLDNKSKIWSANLNDEMIFLYNWEDFDKIENDDKFIDINQLNEPEYNKYKKLNLLYVPNLSLKSSSQISMFFLREIFRYESFYPGSIDNYLSYNYNISKRDKILLYCYKCWSSKVYSYLLNKYGYDTYYTCLKNINNSKYLEINFLYSKKVPIKISSGEIKDKKNNIFFLFGTEENKLEKSSCKNIIMIETELYYSLFRPCDGNVYTINKIDWSNKESYNVICSSPVHCLLTSNYLDYLNLSSYVNIIYSVE